MRISDVQAAVSLDDLTFDRSLIDEYFPFCEFREGQRGCLEFILDSFESGKRCVILEAPTGSGKCLDGDTLILAHNGDRIPIKDLGSHLGIRLHSLNTNLCNGYATLLNHIYSGQKECVKLVTRTGKQLICTLEHKFLTLSGWLPLREIIVGSCLATNRSLVIESNNNYLTPAEAEMIGFMLGDGSFTRYTPRVCINEEETTVKQRFQDLLNELDPRLWLSVIQKKHQCVDYRIVANESRAVSSKPYIKNAAAQLFDKHGLTGVTRNKKFIPDSVFLSGSRVWVAMLVGLWQSDGWVCIKNGKANRKDHLDIGFTNISYQLVAGIQHLLLRFGILSISRYRQMLNSSTGKRHPAWQITILTESQSRFLEVFGRRITKVQKIIATAIIIAERVIGSNVFQIPGDIWDIILPKVADSDLSWRAATPGGLAGAGPALLERRKSSTSRNTVSYFAKTLNDNQLQVLSDSDILWDEIISIDSVGLRDVYDIQVGISDGDPNMSANDIITHNSALGLGVSRFFDKVYYLTIQKILQSQIIGDFGDDGRIVDLKGRATYPCTFYDRHNVKSVSPVELAKIQEEGVDCNHGFCRKKQKRYKIPQCFPTWASDGFGELSNLPEGMQFSACPYYEQVFRAIEAHTCLMNFSSFLYQTHMSKRFGPRNLMIIDEAHQMEPQLLSFIGITLDDRWLQRYNIKLEEYQTPEEYWIFFQETDIITKILALIEDAKVAEDVKVQDEYLSLAKKLRTFMHCMEREEEWVAEYEKGKGYSTVKLKPVFAHSKSYPYILDYGSRCLMMSATILDVGIFCGSLGISRSDIASFRMKNRFPVNHRPIHIRSAGSLTGGKKKMPEWGPKLLEKVDEVVAEYPTDRGIIHTHNFAIADLLVEKSVHRGRFLFQHHFPSKEKMLEVHGVTPGSIIVAPAMHEGLDLMGDLSRFQIICKIPWANFFDDKQLARRVELDTRYYVWLTALKLCQSYGRSIRSENDYAETYVLDGGFVNFLNRAGTMIPSWFRDAII